MLTQLDNKNVRNTQHLEYIQIILRCVYTCVLKVLLRPRKAQQRCKRKLKFDVATQLYITELRPL